MATGRPVECSWVWAGTGGSVRRPVDGSWVCAGTGEPVEMLANEDAETVAAFGFSPAEKVVVTTSLGLMLEADREFIIGGNPKIEAGV